MKATPRLVAMSLIVAVTATVAPAVAADAGGSVNARARALAASPVTSATGAATQPSVTLTHPLYEAAGGLVPVIVTVWNPPEGYRADMSVLSTDGLSVTCSDDPWTNAARASVSRQCYVRLPLTNATYTLHGRVVLTRSGQPTITVEGAATQGLATRGPWSTAPMSVPDAQQIERCGNTTDDVWLTFDDSVNATKLPIFLEILRRNGVRGRFFLTGKWRQKWPDFPARIAQAGHLFGNHTFGHVALSPASDATVFDQIDRGLASTSSPKLLRPPYGAGAFTTRLRDLAAQRSYVLCRWTVDTNDWRGDPASTLTERVAVGDFRTPPVAPGGVILMHGHGEHTLEALQGIIDAVRAKGLRLEPLGTVGPQWNPDASIALTEGGTYAGTNIYSERPISWQTQKRSGAAAPSTHDFFVRVKNRSDLTDTIVVRATSSGTTRMKATFWVGGVDVTPQVTGGGYEFQNLAHGSSGVLVIRIAVGRRAALGSTKKVVVIARSTGNTQFADSVRAIASR